MFEAISANRSTLPGFNAAVHQAVVDTGLSIINRYQRHIRAGGGVPNTSEVIKGKLQNEGIASAVHTFIIFEAPRHLPDHLLNPQGILYKAEKIVFEAASIGRGALEGTLMAISPMFSPVVSFSQNDARDYYDPDAGGTYRGKKK